MQSNPVLRSLLSTRGRNRKLGRAVYSWSIPPVETCPGRTGLCQSICYARKMASRFTHIRKAWRANLNLSERPDFSDLLTSALISIRQIEQKRQGGVESIPLRIHVSGDFYSPEYIHSWMKALHQANLSNAGPVIRPWGYTRIWRVPWLATAVHVYSMYLRTFWPGWLWCSSDLETGPPPKWAPEARMIPRPAPATREELWKWRLRMVQDRCICPVIDSQLTRRQQTTTCQECGRCWDATRCPSPRHSRGRGQVIVFPQH